MTETNDAVKVYRETAGPDGEPMKVRVMPSDATIEELEKAVMEDGAVAMTDEQAAKVDARLEEGVRDGRAL